MDQFEQTLARVLVPPPAKPTTEWVQSLCEGITLFRRTRQVGRALTRAVNTPVDLELGQELMESHLLVTLARVAGLSLPSPVPGVVRVAAARAPELVRALTGEVWAGLLELAWSDEVRLLLLCAPPPTSRADDELTDALLEFTNRRVQLRLLEALRTIAAYRGLPSDEAAAKLERLLATKTGAALREKTVGCLVRFKPSLLSTFVSRSVADRRAALRDCDALADEETLLPWLKARTPVDRELAALALTRVQGLSREGAAALLEVAPRLPARSRKPVQRCLERHGLCG